MTKLSKSERKKAAREAKALERTKREQDLIDVRRRHLLALRFGDRRHLMIPLEDAYQAAEKDALDAIAWSRFLSAVGLGGTFHSRKAQRILEDRMRRFRKTKEAWHATWNTPKEDQKTTV